MSWISIISTGRFGPYFPTWSRCFPSVFALDSVNEWGDRSASMCYLMCSLALKSIGHLGFQNHPFSCHQRTFMCLTIARYICFLYCQWKITREMNKFGTTDRIAILPRFYLISKHYQWGFSNRLLICSWSYFIYLTHHYFIRGSVTSKYNFSWLITLMSLINYLRQTNQCLASLMPLRE